jgi:hypothetical protein
MRSNCYTDIQVKRVYFGLDHCYELLSLSSLRVLMKGNKDSLWFKRPMKSSLLLATQSNKDQVHCVFEH